ncbi:MAG: L,D-transpeptidase family protein [Acidobacteria bacterium]|nr:L,D-transpeptidase family protein [Acidobacteriota bacterium]
MTIPRSLLLALAAGALATAALAVPAASSGPWGWTYAHYDPALFGPEKPLGELVAARGLELRDGKLAGARLLLVKAQRRLELWVGDAMVKAYRVQLGQHPTGRKSRRGDFRTPEGEYAVCAHKPSKYHRGLWLSYPNLSDAAEGLKAKRITKVQHDAIAEALAKGECPPQTTKLGGYLMLHGQRPQHTAELARMHRQRPKTLRRGLQQGDADPAKIREFHDWTSGCAALFNPDVRELYDLLPDGTPVTIVADGPVTKPH